MRNFWGVVCFGSAFLAAQSCWAAEIQSVQGDVSINQGQGYQRVDGRIDANVGDSLMVSPGGSATVSYSDGCQVSVQPGAMTTIDPISPCASGSLAQDFVPHDLVLPLVLGVTMGALLGVLIYEGTRSKKASPSSP